jgi:hypothetical protein
LNGGRALMADVDMQERLVPSQVAYLQRRLAIKTPFASTPEQPTSAAVEYVKDGDGS